MYKPYLFVKNNAARIALRAALRERKRPLRVTRLL
jgi:hypothetical protein